MIKKCRKCGSAKFGKDPCASCGAGLYREGTLRVHKGMPISLGRAHFFHGEVSGLSRAMARGGGAL